MERSIRLLVSSLTLNLSLALAPIADVAPVPPPPLEFPPHAPSIVTNDCDSDQPWNRASNSASRQPSAPEVSGGPDDYGYTWDDSGAFSWIDATGGTHTGLSHST